MADLASELLFEITAVLDSVVEAGPTPNGFRRIRPIKGGSFSGPRLRGEVLPGGADWLLVRPDGSRMLDVRLTLKTDDGHPIYVVSRGLMLIAPETFQRIVAGEEVDPAEYYFRTTPLFETAAERYDWLNRVVAVTVGRMTSTTVVQTVYAIL